MLAWRLCRASYADLRGEGARRFGGRWNSAGIPVVYAASSAALAVLEVRVHLDIPFDLLPEDYVLVTIDFDSLATSTIETVPADPQSMGDAWLRGLATPVLHVPSLIVPESANLLFNPAHDAASSAVIVRQRPFSFDPRLWHPM